MNRRGFLATTATFGAAVALAGDASVGPAATGLGPVTIVPDDPWFDDLVQRPVGSSCSGAEETRTVLRSSLTSYLDPLRVPPMLCPKRGYLTVRMQSTWVRLHSELPLSRVWAYDGHFPGPTIEVRRGQRLRVAWHNDISGCYPIVDVRTQDPDGTTKPGYTAQDEVVAGVAELPPWTVVHLHGAHTNAMNDGWAFNAVPPGHAQLAEYPNDQQATALWYHDHAMSITALNVLTGLAGMYLIRDDEEDSLALPCGEYEVPLVIADRNLTTTRDGQFTGQLMRKLYDDGVTDHPFLGPFTLVNGTIWPYFDVEPRWYRFRMLNASNSRTYQLRLADETGVPIEPDLARRAVKQIGTDSGLLPEPVDIPIGGLTIASAERADMLVDFSVFAGKRVQLLNTAGDAGDNQEVMQFRVARDHACADSFTLPEKVSGSFVRLTHETLPPAHERRWVLLTPASLTGMPMIWEMIEVDESSVTLPSDGVVQIDLPGQGLKTLKRVAVKFEETVNYFTKYGGWELWNFLNLSGSDVPDSHPMHIHVMAFQALSRNNYTVDAFTVIKAGQERTVGLGTLPGRPIAFASPGTLDDNEQGWKDVIRVAAGELVSVAGQFGGGTGEFTYHCHILEHEDESMMRPFVVMPEEILALHPMGPGGGHH
ncbi:spore coat protein A [Kibdelosporangium banguiense]|uniref:Spore coat protein A n=1 Tax=Kibdelosporangium banguiense TaxID=1365924 RepID=A0ABS4TW42_9PSEU|nr:multicopper oxidase domain-containing protein [Kibdelosporangium banguiense]MBP2328621.1 spore coat protein A [Kibdelosporangium banguiense]